MAKTWNEKDVCFHRFCRELVAAEILEAGLTHPHSVHCPHCGHLNRPPDLVTEQFFVCAGERHAPGGRLISKGCGQTFAIKPARPLHSVHWADDPPEGVPVVRACWREGVPNDHPARARYNELLGKLLVELNG